MILLNQEARRNLLLRVDDQKQKKEIMGSRNNQKKKNKYRPVFNFKNHNIMSRKKNR